MHSHEPEQEDDDDADDAPTRMLQVRDRGGHIYTLEWRAADYGWSLRLANSINGRIGYAHAQLRQDALFLADLRIEDHGRIPQTMLQRLLGLKPKSENYRNRGLGSLLLQHLE